MQPVIEKPALPSDLRVLVPQLQQVFQQYGYVINRMISEPEFTAPTLLNSWVNYASGYEVGYYKDHFGRVHLKGLVRDGTVNTTLFTLPEGFRPSGPLLFPSLQYNGVLECLARVDVASNGQVAQSVMTGVTNGTGYLSLNGISFAAV